MFPLRRSQCRFEKRSSVLCCFVCHCLKNEARSAFCYHWNILTFHVLNKPPRCLLKGLSIKSFQTLTVQEVAFLASCGCEVFLIWNRTIGAYAAALDFIEIFKELTRRNLRRQESIKEIEEVLGLRQFIDGNEFEVVICV